MCPIKGELTKLLNETMIGTLGEKEPHFTKNVPQIGRFMGPLLLKF